MATKKGNTGKRYTDDQKNAILAFVNSQGRGGISAATRKFGVSYIALKRWMNPGATRGRLGGRQGKVRGLDGRTQRKVKTAQKALKAMLKEAALLKRLLRGLAR